MGQSSSSLADFFSHVHVINLKRRPDRLQEMMRKMEACRWP